MAKIKLTFKDADDLNRWFDHCCTMCCMANREGRDRCDVCKVNRQYKTSANELNMEVNDDD